MTERPRTALVLYTYTGNYKLVEIGVAKLTAEQYFNHVTSIHKSQSSPKSKVLIYWTIYWIRIYLYDRSSNPPANQSIVIKTRVTVSLSYITLPL